MSCRNIPYDSLGTTFAHFWSSALLLSGVNYLVLGRGLTPQANERSVFFFPKNPMK